MNLTLNRFVPKAFLLFLGVIAGVPLGSYWTRAQSRADSFKTRVGNNQAYGAFPKDYFANLPKAAENADSDMRLLPVATFHFPETGETIVQPILPSI